MKPIVFFCTAILLVLLPVSAFSNSAPVVSNVIASQRADNSKLVDIYYDLADADGDSCTIWVVASSDGGSTWRVPAMTFTGAVGPGVTPGGQKRIIWDAGSDIPGYVGSFKVRVYADDGKGYPMVFVPAGEFPYGGGTQVFVNNFWIDKYEITNEFYCEFLNRVGLWGYYFDSRMEISQSGGWGTYLYSPYPDRENYPVRFVNWDDANAFATWRSAVEGMKYRIPNEQEWQKAAAWDPIESHLYAYGFHRDTLDLYPHTWANFNNYVGAPTAVGYYNGTGGRHDSKSYYGCYDMSGNVWEWVGTPGYDPYFGWRCNIGGGAWNSGGCGVVGSSYYTSSSRTGEVGFRLVRVSE